MIKELYVKTCSEYDEKGLVPFPDRQAREKILIFESRNAEKFAYNINIYGGLLLIDLNDRYRIASIELGVYRKNWKLLNKLLRPQPTINGCIEFINIDSKSNEFDDLSLVVYTDQQQSAAKIEIGVQQRSSSIWVALSKYCFAKIRDDYLVGFWLDISAY